MVGRNFRVAAERAGFELDAPDRSRLDLLDAAATSDYVRNTQPQFVVHCAGIVGGIQANIAAPFDFAIGNLQIGMNVVRASFEAGVSRLMNLGSSCMYPRTAENPLKENSILTGELEPTNEGYAIAKITVARLCDYLSAQHALQYKTLIPCNLYGLWDDFDPQTSHMIPAVINKIHHAITTQNDTVEIWGDGTARREFMYAGDLADFMCFAIDKFSQLGSYTNVGLGRDYTINDYYDVVARVAGFAGNFSHDLSRPAGMKQKLVDISKQSELGWSPATSLEDGIRSAYSFYLKEVSGD